MVSNCIYLPTLSNKSLPLVWQYGSWSFQTGCTKLERFLPKNQHPQRKLLNFENWISGASEVFKNQSFKINYFHPPIHLTSE
jgi:hypothetical protein